MPANVESMFSVKETPWHGIGHVVNEAPTIADAIKLAGLDWSVDVQSLSLPSGANVDEFGKAFVRSDNQKVLGLVGPNTHPLQNTNAFDFFQPFIDDKQASLETAGSLDEGRKIWVMAKINRDNSVIVKGDEVAKFVLLSNSHDGTTAVRTGFTPIRVVCANTLAMAHKDGASKLIRIKHTKQMQKNLELIRETMNLADEQFEATAEQFRFLASRQISVADLRKYVKIVLKIEKEDSEVSTRMANTVKELETRFHQKVYKMLTSGEAEFDFAARENEIQEKVTENFEAGLGTDNKPSRGSYWTAYNAVNEWLNYERGHNTDTRMNSLWFGPNANTNTLALSAAMEMANAA
jgi:phage/plasmid-like protein (TIGR03299 family)